MKTQRTIPILRIFDVEKAKQFYVDWLGFKVMWMHRFEANFPVYMEVSLDSSVFHLSEHHGDCSPGSHVFIWCTGLKAFHKKLMDKKYKYDKPGLAKAQWGNALTMQVTDPFGNKLSFNESQERSVKIKDPKKK